MTSRASRSLAEAKAMSGGTLTTPVEEAVELTEQQSGNSTRTLVPLPSEVTEEWGLKYGEYVRITLSSGENTPQLAIAPLGDLSYRERTNDLKLTTNKGVALPRRLVRAFSLAGDVWWTEYGSQLVGTLTEYSDSQTLFEVSNYYTDTKIPEEDDQRTTFAALTTIADIRAPHDSSEMNSITTHRGAVRHTIPEDIPITEDDELVFVLFHDGDDFIIGLIPHEGDDDTPFFQYQYNPMSASPDSHLESLPSILLDYEKDKVQFHTDRSGTTYYTIPKQVAACLWLDDGYKSDWLKIGDAYFANLTPGNQEQSNHRADPATGPN